MIGALFGLGIRYTQLRDELDELKMKNGVASVPAASKQKGDSGWSQSPNYVSYIRWGKKSCAGDANLVYSGRDNSH